MTIDVAPRRYGPAPKPRPFPLEPLYELAFARCRPTNERLNGIVYPNDVAEQLGIKREMLRRWRESGLRDVDADRAATALGLHPMHVWPELWLAVAECNISGSNPTADVAIDVCSWTTPAAIDDLRAQVAKSSPPAAEEEGVNLHVASIDVGGASPVIRRVQPSKRSSASDSRRSRKVSPRKRAPRWPERRTIPGPVVEPRPSLDARGRARSGTRRPHGAGTISEVEPGYWCVRVRAGVDELGRPRVLRRAGRGTRADAEQWVRELAGDGMTTLDG